MTNAEYWKQRFTQLEAAQNRKGATAYLEMEKRYNAAQNELEAQIARWYQRFADSNGISLAQAKQWLKGQDLAEFKWDVKEYIKYGKENAINGAWMQELENASSKFHISRLEALQIQTQNSLETMFAQQLGTMIPIEYIEGLETAELTGVLIPGEDEEDTEALRKRYFDSFNEKAFGGNVQDYLTKTNGIPGVGSTKVTRVWNSDISPASMIPSVKVKSWYESTISTLSGDAADWLRTVYTAAAEKKLTTGGTVLLTILNSDYGIASSTLLETVQNTIDPPENAGDGYGLAPIGHVVSVKSADSVQVQVKTTLTFDSGYSWSNLQNSINTAISDYLLELRKSWADTAFLVVRVSQIETRLLSIKGIVDIDNTRINGTAENLTLGRYEVPMFGGASA